MTPIIEIIRTTSANLDFRMMVMALDKGLYCLNGGTQKHYNLFVIGKN